MDSLKGKFDRASNYLVKENPTLGIAAAFGLIWTLMGSPVSYENHDANILSKTAIYATSFAGNTGLIWGGFMLGGIAGARLTGRSDPQTQMFAKSIGGSVAASIGASLLMPTVNGIGNAVFAYEDMNPEQQQEYQLAATQQADKTIKTEDGRIVSYDIKANVLTIA
jgi:hypothetical protein